MMRYLRQLMVSILMMSAGAVYANEDIGYAEDLLDTLLQHCRAGHLEQVLSIRQAIEEQLSPPQEIRNILAQITQNGCKPQPRVNEAAYIEWSITAGFDNNVNQGISADSVTFGSALKPVTLVLSSDYKPVSSPYIATTLTRQIHTDNGWLLRGTLGYKQLSNYSQLNTTGLNLSARYPLKPMDTPSVVQLGWTQSWLGTETYRRIPSVEWISQFGKLGEEWQAQGQIQWLDQATNTAENANIYTLKTSRKFRWGTQGLALLGAGLLRDQSTRERAGGDRQGTTFEGMLQHPFAQGQLQLHVNHVRWSTEKDFSPNLVDHIRRNRTTQLTLGYQTHPTAHGRYYVELQRTNVQDNVPLYAHTASGLMAGWIQQWR